MCKKIFGTVIHGLGKGKDFGFPTVNIKLIDNSLQIAHGVYAVIVTVNSQNFQGMLYVGTRPTLNLHETTIEAHIFDFNEDIYNHQISFQILQKIRNEIHFKNIEELITQLHQDKEAIYNYFPH